MVMQRTRVTFNLIEVLVLRHFLSFSVLRSRALTMSALQFLVQFLASKVWASQRDTHSFCSFPFDGFSRSLLLAVARASIFSSILLSLPTYTCRISSYGSLVRSVIVGCPRMIVAYLRLSFNALASSTQSKCSNYCTPFSVYVRGIFKQPCSR